MMSIQEVKKYYDENAVKEWERLEEHPFEFIFTTYRMDPYIHSGDKILDIGGGPGRYSIYYAKKGCDVTLVDLSLGNIELAKAKAAENHVVFQTKVGNCLDIDSMELDMYDHVFLMGPLYHLLEKEEREKAVELALKHLKPGGDFYCSFILSFAGLIYDLKNGPGYLPEDLEDECKAKLIDAIVTGTEYTGPAFTSVCFLNQHEIEPFLEPFGLEKLHLFGQEGFLALNEKQLKECKRQINQRLVREECLCQTIRV